MKRLVANRFGFVLLMVVVFVVGGCGTRGRVVGVVGGGKPLIGITTVPKYDEDGNVVSAVGQFTYVRGVVANGGVPVLLPSVGDMDLVREYVERLDGLVLVGGADIPPAVYGEVAHETVYPLSKARFAFESEMIKGWMKSGKPVLGICLGMQFTNVMQGGTMIQDIPSEVGAKVKHRGGVVYHDVVIDEGSQLGKLLGKRRVSVRSIHHQAVDKIGRDLKVVGRSDDGVVEAMERTKGGYGMFVQWHPEKMTENLRHRDAIFRAMILECGE